MTRELIMMLMSIATIAAAQLAAADTVDWEERSRAVLLERLQRAHPDIREWNVEMLLGARQRERLRGGAFAGADVARIGARSAVRLRASQATAMSPTIWFAVRGMREVVTTREDVAPGTALEPGASELVLRDVIPLECKPLGDPARLQGMRARAALRAGSVICEEHLEPLPAVARGERVTVYSSAGRVRVTGSAIAAEDGCIGQRLKVRSVRSRELYVVRVTGRQEVEVDE